MVPELGKGLSAPLHLARSQCGSRGLGAAPWMQRLGLEMLRLERLSAAQVRKAKLGTQRRVPDPSPQLLPGTLTAQQLEEHPRPPDRVPFTPYLPSSTTSLEKLTTWSTATVWNPLIPGRKGSSEKSSRLLSLKPRGRNRENSVPTPQPGSAGEPRFSWEDIGQSTDLPE